MGQRGRTFEPTKKHRGQVEAMHAYGIPEEAIADKLGITRNTLRKHFKYELKTGATTANAAVGEFLFATITGKNGFKDAPSRVTAAMFWARTRMGWNETVDHQIDGTKALPVGGQPAILIYIPDNGRDPDMVDVTPGPARIARTAPIVDEVAPD